MPLKVCLHIYSFNAGGAQRQMVNLARELSVRGVQVVLLHAQNDLRNAYYLETLRGTTVEVINTASPDYLREGIRLSRMHEEFFADLPAPSTMRVGILYLAGALSRIRPDIVHSYLDKPNCAAGCAAVLADTPGHLASFRNVDPETLQNADAPLIHTLYSYLLGHGRTHFEANSKAGIRHYARWLNLHPKRIAYSPNGIDRTVYMETTPQIPSLRQALGLPESAPILLTLSRFMEQKSPRAMLDIFSRIADARPDCHYLIAGAGMDALGEMDALVKERGLEGQVHLLGVRSDVASLMAGADVFLLPSREEGFPNAVMEAMTAQLPVVASNVGGIPDLVRHGRDGFLHETTDLDGMAQSVLTLLADADMRARFGRDARQWVETEFSLQKLGDRTLRKYAELLAVGTPETS